MPTFQSTFLEANIQIVSSLWVWQQDIYQLLMPTLQPTFLEANFQTHLQRYGKGYLPTFNAQFPFHIFGDKYLVQQLNIYQLFMPNQQSTFLEANSKLVYLYRYGNRIFTNFLCPPPVPQFWRQVLSLHSKGILQLDVYQLFIHTSLSTFLEANIQLI